VFGIDEKISLKPDGSYVFQDTDGDLVFEAQVAPDIRIVDTFADRLRRVLDPAKPRVFAYSAFATPMFRLRMFNETSNPVRTPSYMPKVSAQFAWFQNRSRAADAPDSHAGPIDMWLLHAIPFGHHSNGQKDCLFVDQRQVDGECVPDENTPRSSPQTNTQTGSFSTNYIRVGLAYRRLHPTGDNADIEDAAWVTRREWGLDVAVEMNPKGFVGGSISNRLSELYGPTRLKATADLAVRNWALPLLKKKRICGRAAAEVSLEYIPNGPPAVSNVRAIAEAACLPSGWGGTGVFVRYYRGQDYYNVNFLREIHRLQFGLTFHQARFLMFPIPSS
jgi:hypothetical protein